jgi:hypothetical protein
LEGEEGFYQAVGFGSIDGGRVVLEIAECGVFGAGNENPTTGVIEETCHVVLNNVNYRRTFQLEGW